MEVLFWLYVITFVAYPLIAIYLSKYISFRRDKYWLSGVLLVFILSLWMYFQSYSWKGDIMNYLWVSWGYFFFCLFAYTLVRRKKLILKISGILGCIITAIGFIQLFFTLFAVALISLSLVSDKEYTIHHRKDEYVVRRYVISFATLMNSTYTFVTYRSCKFLPFEKRLDKTSFVSPEETTLNFEDPSFQIEIGGEHAAEWISFSSIGESYKKELGKDGLEYIKESSPLEEKSIIRPSLPRPGRVPVW